MKNFISPKVRITILITSLLLAITSTGFTSATIAASVSGGSTGSGSSVSVDPSPTTDISIDTLIPKRSNQVMVASLLGRTYLIDQTTKAPTVSEIPTTYPALRAFGISADGKRLAYSTLIGGYPTGDLTIEDIAGGNARTKIVPDLVLEAKWSPTNPHEIVYIYSAGSKFNIAYVNVNTGEQRVLDTGDVDMKIIAWSDSGDGVTYYTNTYIGDSAYLQQNYVRTSSEKSSTIGDQTLTTKTPTLQNPEVIQGKNLFINGSVIGNKGVSSGNAYSLVTPDNLHTVLGQDIGGGSIFVSDDRGGAVREITQGILLQTTNAGVLVRNTTDEKVNISFVDWQGTSTLVTNTQTVSLNFPMQSFTVVQGGEGYSGVASCRLYDHLSYRPAPNANSGRLSFAYDMQDTVHTTAADHSPPAHILAAAGGIVVIANTNATCNVNNNNATCSLAPVPATCPGSGSASDPSGHGFGNYVVIQHNTGEFTQYAHMDYGSVKVNTTDKKVVCQGQYIGDQGHSGWSDGSNGNGCGDHLHFQLQNVLGAFEQSVPVSFSEVTSNGGQLQCLTPQYHTASTEIASCTPVTIPTAPTGLSIGGATSTTLTLTFTDNSTNEDAIWADRTLPAAYSYNLGTFTGTGVRTYTITGLTPNTNNCFTVRANNTAGSSSSSNSACGTTLNSTQTGVIQGYKLDVNNNQFNNPGATLSVAGQTFGPSTNPYFATGLATGNQTVTSTVPSGYTVSYSACVNCTSHTASSYVTGSSATVNVPANGYVDLWWKYTAVQGTSTGVIQGYKLDVNNNQFNNPGATLSVAGQTFGPSTNPYFATALVTGNQTVTSTVPSGYTVSYSVCVNCTNHPTSSYVTGSSATVSVPATGNVDLWWKYTAVQATPTPTPVPTPIPTPAAPTNLSLTTLDSTSMLATFTDNSTDETTFWMDNTSSNSNSFSMGGVSGTGTRTMAITGLVPSTFYCYHVKASNNTGSSSYSNTFCNTTAANPIPATPTNLSIGSVTSSSLVMTFTDNSTNETAFWADSTSGNIGASTITGVAGTGTRTISVTQLDPNTTYCYHVKASNGSGSAGYTNTACATTLNAIPNAPTNLSVGSATRTTLTLTFTDNSTNETAFWAERTSPTSLGINIGSFTGTGTRTWAATSLNPNTNYCYRVKAANSLGSSNYTSTICAKTTL